MIKTRIPSNINCIGIAADHGGFELKEKLKTVLIESGYEIIEFGAISYNKEDDYPDMVIPLAKAISKGEVHKGIAVCGSGVGACIAVNKVPGARASVITDPFSAHQGVEDDDMNVICLGGNITGYSLAMELVNIFLNSRFKETDRYVRRLGKVSILEMEKPV